jgi:hypothetical protein
MPEPTDSPVPRGRRIQLLGKETQADIYHPEMTGTGWYKRKQRLWLDIGLPTDRSCQLRVPRSSIPISFNFVLMGLSQHFLKTQFQQNPLLIPDAFTSQINNQANRQIPIESQSLSSVTNNFARVLSARDPTQPTRARHYRSASYMPEMRAHLVM